MTWKINIKTIFSIFIVCFLVLQSCIKKYREDIYQQIPLNSKLTKETIVNSNQIFQTQGDLILLFNASKEADYYDPHLLFYNNENILYSACYYASERIDSIKKNVIHGLLNYERDKRKHRYRNDLPSKYTLNLTSYRGVSTRFGNKIIEEIKISDSSMTAQFKVIEAKNYHILTGKNLNDVNPNLLKLFTLKNTVMYKISDLLFDSKNGTIQIRRLNEKNEMINEFLIVKNAQIMDSFFEDLWNKLDQR